MASGAIGAPLMMHCSHRNPSVPGHYTSDMAINDTAVHDVDTLRWLLDDEVAAAAVIMPRRNAGPGARDPMIVLFEMAGGAIVDVEVSVNIAYGYDIRGEIWARPAWPSSPRHGPREARGLLSGRVPTTGASASLRAFDVEFQEWLAPPPQGGPPVPAPGTATPRAVDVADSLHVRTRDCESRRRLVDRRVRLTIEQTRPLSS